MLTACVTNSPSSSDKSEIHNGDRCEHPRSCVGAVNSPTMCFAGRLSGESLNSGHGLRGWGENRCAAENAFFHQVCQRGLDPEKVSMSCVPDTGGGECPLKEVFL